MSFFMILRVISHGNGLVISGRLLSSFVDLCRKICPDWFVGWLVGLLGGWLGAESSFMVNVVAIGNFGYVIEILA